MASQYRKITDGPGLFKLSYALFGGSNEEQLPVSFSVQDPNGAKAPHSWVEFIRLVDAQREDGSGKRWNLVGYNTANHAKVVIFYDLDKKTGTMTFVQ